MKQLARYNRRRSWRWNYLHAPPVPQVEVPPMPGSWSLCGLSVDSPLGISAGPLLNGAWVRYYAALGFDVLTWKSVRSRAHRCHPLPNLQPVECPPEMRAGSVLQATRQMSGSWAVSFGMPSVDPAEWRRDMETTRRSLPAGKLLAVSVVGTVQPGWSIDDLAEDYALCARWAVESGADIVEANFSCPNVTTCDGQLFQNPADAAVVADAIRSAIGSVPLVVKVGHVADSEEAERLLTAMEGSVSALSMTNSVVCRVQQEGEFLFAGHGRGICGGAILPASVRQIGLFDRLMRQRHSGLQLIAVGGISDAADVQACLRAGAVSCQVATAAMIRPDTAVRIREGWVSAENGAGSV